MTQPESRLVKRIKAALKARGHYVIKHHGGEYGSAGVPDLLLCVQGKFVGLEVKRPETRTHVSPRQEYEHRLIRKSSGIVAVVTSVEEALKIIKSAEAYGVCVGCGQLTTALCGYCASDE